MNLPRFSMGIGDRFALQGQAQLAAFVKLKERGTTVAPVWNKSNREHNLIGSRPEDVRAEADQAVQAAGWKDGYFVDADHIGLKTVDRFLTASDFFTIDVADFIGQPAAPALVEAFAKEVTPASGQLTIPGVERPIRVDHDGVHAIASKYLTAVSEAGAIYRHIAAHKAAGRFVIEVSMDETDQPQTPEDLWFILAALAREGVPVRTIAPKFTGRFNKGVDFVGDLAVFEREFQDDLAVIAHAVTKFGLPADLKLSVHSGSDKFSLYSIIGRAVRSRGAGLHLKTAGTNWLEEVAGLAEAGGDALNLAKDIYLGALSRIDEVSAPYAPVIDIDRRQLPSPEIIRGWSGQRLAAAITHDQQNPDFNPSLRQLVHVGFKIAAEMGQRYTDAVRAHSESIGRRVTANLFEKHLKPLFLPAN
jgi:hypothetical protein